MKEFYIRNANKVAYVDDEDYDKLCRHTKNWCFTTTSILGWSSIHKMNVYMARIILNLPASGGVMVVDHINGDIFLNIKSNLRIISCNANAKNRKLNNNSTTKFKGVSFYKRDKVFQAHIRVDNKLIYLGRFKSAEEASNAYIDASSKYFRHFTRQL